MTASEQRTKLIKIAAELLMDDAGPSPYLDDHERLPKRVPQRWWQWLCGKILAAEDQRKDWARRVRDVADAIGASETSSDRNEK